MKMRPKTRFEHDYLLRTEPVFDPFGSLLSKGLMTLSYGLVCIGVELPGEHQSSQFFKWIEFISRVNIVVMTLTQALGDDHPISQ